MFFLVAEFENNETLENCVVREVMEEFGIAVTPLKKVYVYENEKSIESFFLCNWVSGTFGTGKGEEFQPAGKDGLYIPKQIEMSKISSLPLMPPEISDALVADFNTNGKTIRNDILKIIK